MANGTFSLSVTIPTSVLAALNPDDAGRQLVVEALKQAEHDARDPRNTSGVTTHNFGAGNVQVATWTYTPAS
jgi:hypothetical protein